MVLSGSAGATDEWSAAACNGANSNEQFLNFTLEETATLTAALNVQGTIAVLSANCNQTVECGIVTNPIVSDVPSVSATLPAGSYTLVVDSVDGDFEVDISVQ